MLISFEGKRVIVAGAARGIGHAIAVAFAENGGEVTACDRLFEEVETFAGPAKSGGGTIRAAKVDVTDKSSIESVLAQAGGPIDVLVYVAGGIRGQRPKPLEQVPVEDFHQIVDANLTGAFLFAQACGRDMLKRKHGRIVNVASVAGLRSAVAGPHYAGYVASKAGLMGLTRELAASWGPHGIRVNAIAPGFFHSRLADAVIAQMEPHIQARNPIPRVGAGGEIKGVVVFLAADASNYVTGQTIVVDGGGSIV